MDKTTSRGFSKTLFNFHRTYVFFVFLRRDHDPATAAAVAVHRACNNRLQRRYNATAPISRQHHTRDRSALYCCVELLWKAPEIHHPSHLMVPGISRLLLSLFCFVRHKTQIHVTAHNCSASAKSTLQPASQSRPAAAGNAMHVW